DAAQVDEWGLGARPVDVLGLRVAARADFDAGVALANGQHPRIADDDDPRRVCDAAIREDAGALLGANPRTVAEHEAQHGQVLDSGGHQATLRSTKRLTTTISTKVMSSMVMESTAIGPQSLLSRKSNIVTETVLVRAVNSR